VLTYQKRAEADVRERPGEIVAPGPASSWPRRPPLRR